VAEIVRDRDRNAKKRRSTRVAQALPIIVRGTDAQGLAFLEHTSTISINCYGCRFQSKHEMPLNTEVTLEIPHRSPGHLPRHVRAQVTWVTPARTGHERIQIGVELETPGNVWGMAFPPEDWFPYPGDRLASASPDAPPSEAAQPGPPSLKVVAPPSSGAHPVVQPPSETDRGVEEAELRERNSLAPQISRIVADAKLQLEEAAEGNAARTREAARRLAEVVEKAERLCDELSGIAAKIEQSAEEQIRLSLEKAQPRIQQVLDASVEAASRAAKEQFDRQVREVNERFCLELANVATAHRESFQRARVEAENNISTLCSGLDAEMSKARLLLNDLRTGTTGLEEAGNRLDALRKTANEELKWHSKRIENQVGLTIERATDLAAKTLGEKAAEVTSRFAGQLDHYSRSYVEHTQAQLEDVGGSAAVRSQEVLQQMVETAAAGLRQELAQIEERLRTLGELSDGAASQSGARGEGASPQPEWNQAADAAIEEFKKRLENVANSWLVTTAAILNERVKENLDTLINEAEERLRRSE
jgi:regulator of replication initiation timing